MKQKIDNTLKFLPTDLKELERRAVLSTKAQGRWATEPWVKETENGEVKYYAWNDGGGQSYGLWLTTHDTALILVFDHECAFNFYADEPEDEGLQEAFYEGVPKEFTSFFTNQPETYEHLNIETNGKELYAASGVIWFADGKWNVNNKYYELAEERKDDGGLKYCLNPLTFNSTDVDEYAKDILENITGDKDRVKILVSEYKAST
jgi:hypothetical protein